jgi:hypothetical protein
VAIGWVGTERASETYGVVLAADGRVAEQETKARREAIRGLRRQWPLSPWRSDDVCRHPGGAGRWRVAENLDLTADGTLICRRCAHAVDSRTGSFAVARRPLRAAGPWMALRHDGDAPNFVLEEVSCPSCATLFSVREIRRTDDAAGEHRRPPGTTV